MTNKENFLIEHNKLSPVSLQADLMMLTQFREQAKISLFKNDDWNVDKLRRPFIIWLTGLALVQKKLAKKPEEKDSKKFNTYPYEEA